MSLRNRLTLLTIGAFTLGLIVLGMVVPRLVRGFLTERLDQDLVSSEARATRSLDGLIRTTLPSTSGVRVGTMNGDAYFELRDAAGNVVATMSPELSPPKFAMDFTDAQLSHAFTVNSVDGKSQWRVLAFVPPGNEQTTASGFLLTAIPTTSVDQTVTETVKAVTFAAIAILIALGWLTYVLVGIGLRPLRKMQQSAAGISSAGDLHQRVEQPAEKTELGQLGATLNGMLGRLETSFEEQQQNQARLRRFVSDASHELRTPLTSIRGYAELHRRGYKDPVQVDRSMDRIEQESSRMSRLVEDLLALARADEKRAAQQKPVRLDEVVAGLVEDFRVVHTDRRTNTTLANATVIGDQALITQSVANVLANAGIHTPPETPIDITLTAGSSSAVLTIADHGVGISPDDAPHVFDRFYRSDVSRNRESGGSGLGLSITAAIVAAHGGTITTSPTAGGGATFTISLPLAPPTEATPADVLGSLEAPAPPAVIPADNRADRDAAASEPTTVPVEPVAPIP